jgi:Glycine transporter
VSTVVKSPSSPFSVIHASRALAGGGVIRDVLLHRSTPATYYHEHPLYTTIAVLVAGLQVLSAKTLDLDHPAATLGVIAVGLALRIVAYRRGWRLPRGLEWSRARWQGRKLAVSEQPAHRRHQRGTAPEFPSPIPAISGSRSSRKRSSLHRNTRGLHRPLSPADRSMRPAQRAGTPPWADRDAGSDARISRPGGAQTRLSRGAADVRDRDPVSGAMPRVVRLMAHVRPMSPGPR